MTTVHQEKSRKRFRIPTVFLATLFSVAVLSCRPLPDIDENIEELGSQDPSLTPHTTMLRTSPYNCEDFRSEYPIAIFLVPSRALPVGMEYIGRRDNAFHYRFSGDIPAEVAGNTFWFNATIINYSERGQVAPSFCGGEIRRDGMGLKYHRIANRGSDIAVEGGCDEENDRFGRQEIRHFVPFEIRPSAETRPHLLTVEYYLGDCSESASRLSAINTLTVIVDRQ